MTPELPPDTRNPQPGDHAAAERERLKSLLDESQQRFQAIFENALDPILLMDDSGRFVDGNPVACELLGCRREALSQMTLWEVTPGENQASIPGLLEHFLAAGKQIGEYTVLCKDGVKRDVEYRAVANILPGLHLGMFRDITERKRAEAALQEHATSLQILSRRVMDIQEQERRHLAHELHDEIGQVLSTVSMHLQAAKEVGDALCQSRLEDSIRIVDHAIQQVRNLSLDLRPAMLDDLGLVSTLRWYSDRQAQAAGFRLHFSARSAGTRIPAELEIACYRVAQEALTNVLRHAHAKQVWLEYRQTDDEVRLLIRDDGVGFDTTTIRQQSVSQTAVGLLGMQERVELGGGKLDVESQLGKGTRLQVWFPVSRCTIPLSP